MNKSIFFIFLLFASPGFAADHYAATSGSASWANSISESTPCSIQTAFANASAGDTVYLRGGTYAISTGLDTINAGTSDSNRIIIKNYTGEEPIISTSATGIGAAVRVRDNYWTFDGIEFRGSPSGEGGSLVTGYDSGTWTGTTVQNCKIHMISPSSPSGNTAGIRFSDAVNVLIKNNLIWVDNTAGMGQTVGVQLWGGVGTKVLNNEMYDLYSGVFQKHPNCDTSLSTGAEIAYNYLHDLTDRSGIMGLIGAFHIHDNISEISSNDLSHYSTNGGSTCTRYSGLVENNTYTGRVSCGGDANFIGDWTNNIIGSYVFGCSPSGDWDYNAYMSSGTFGTNYISNADIVFEGGSTPSTIAGFALTSSSDGYQAGSDGGDMGADVSLVGIDASTTSSGGACSGMFSGAF